jgi:hypothetical protein
MRSTVHTSNADTSLYYIVVDLYPEDMTTAGILCRDGKVRTSTIWDTDEQALWEKDSDDLSTWPGYWDGLKTATDAAQWWKKENSK